MYIYIVYSILSLEAKWIALLLDDGIVHIVYELERHRLDLPANSARLHDNEWHRVVLMRAANK